MRIAEFSGRWEGQRIDGFPLDRFLGSGESSAVFLTRYEARQAAIKLVHVEPQNMEALLSRWRAASKLSHPHLVRIFSTGRCSLDGMPLLYVVTEFAEENLSQVVPDRPLSTDETRAMLAPALSALAYIHQQGFIHGHLKPANIVAVDDQVKVSSDGLCRIGASCADAPSPYDAPERAKGVVSPAGDIWSLGVTLVEVLTQNRMETTGDLPEPFSAIALHCQERNPAERWTIAQISQRLGTSFPVAFHRRRYFAPVGAVILLVLLLVLVAGVIAKHSETSAETSVPPVAKQGAKAADTQTTAPVNPPVNRPVTPPVNRAPATPAPVAVTQASADQPMPELAEHALATIHGKVIVNVRVDVDASGAVTDAKLEYTGSSKYLAASALQAARRWRFKPETIDGQAAPQQWRVQFEFRSSGIKAQPRRLSP